MSEEKRGTFIHGIAASEHIDSSGERIKVEGIDISSLTKDGTFNYEHDSKSPSSIVGKIFEAKKILKASDCENDNHTYFWNKLQMPFLYVAGELFDGVGHSEAGNVAAMMRYDQQTSKNKDNKKLINFSIEGSRLDKRGANILKCIARKISITITPCNKVCEAEEMKEDQDKGSTSAKKAATEDFSFIQDIMGKGEYVSSCQILKSEDLKKTNWGEMGFINTNIKSEKKVEKNLGRKVSRRAKDRDERRKRRQRVKRTPSRQAPIKPQQARQPRADRHVIADEKGTVRKAAKKRLGKYESNMRKALAASAGMGSAPGTKVQGAALQKEIATATYNTSGKVLPAKAGSFKKKVRKALNKRASEALVRFDKKEELAKFLSQKLPNICDKQKLAIAKTVAYVREKRRENKLASLIKADVIDLKSRKVLSKDPNPPKTTPRAAQRTGESSIGPKYDPMKALVHHLEHYNQHKGASAVAKYAAGMRSFDQPVEEMQVPGTLKRRVEHHQGLASQHLKMAQKYHSEIGNLIPLDDIIKDYRKQSGPRFTAPKEFTPYNPLNDKKQSNE